MLLAGDVGGTTTHLALVTRERGPLALIVEKRLPSREFDNVEVLVHSFLEHYGPVERACFGVAGPVVNGRATLTNLPWVLDASALADALGIASVTLLNDLQATAMAVPKLKNDDLVTLNIGQPWPNGVMAVVAPGTGLGEAFMTWEGTRYRAHPSEGGHADFAPLNSKQADLLAHLQKQHDHVSYERVCSGSAIPILYAWLKERGHAAEPAWLAAELNAAADQTPIIVNAALKGPGQSELCRATLEMFVQILAAEAGNLALRVLALGGVYIGGGIAPRILPLLTPEHFTQVFRRKGRLSELIGQIPVRVIRNSKAALIGAAVEVLQPD